MIGRGVAPASALTHARILLKANQGEAGPGWTDAAIAVAVEVNSATVARVRMKYVAAGLDAAVYRKPPARQYRRRLDGELEVIESVSYETVRQALKQTGSSRG